MEPFRVIFCLQLMRGAIDTFRRLIKSNTTGLLTGVDQAGTFGNVFPFMLHSHFWLPVWTLLMIVAYAQANTAEFRMGVVQTILQRAARRMDGIETCVQIKKRPE